MGSEIASPSATLTEPKRLLMPNNLLKAAIEGNEADLKRLLGLNDEKQGHPLHTKVPIEDGAPTELSESDLLRSVAGMEDTILHVLSAYGHENLVFTICTKDSSLLKACNVRNETPFHHAARFGHGNTILKLIEHAKSELGEAGLKELLRQKNCLGETVLHEAARHGDAAVVSALMEEDLELAGLVNYDYVSPLYLATTRGSVDMVQNMVEKMLNHEITPSFYSGPKHQTALHAAVLTNAELTEELLKLNSEPLGKGVDETGGRTPLHFTASTGNHKIAELLLDKDPSLAYIKDSNGSFPVHTAARMGHVKMITLLLERYPDSGQLLDGNGRNFLHIAIEANKLNVFFYTFPRWFIIYLTIMVNIVSIGMLNTTDLLKDRGPSPYWNKMFNRMVNTMDNNGNTPLHLAAEHGYITFMCSLLNNNKLGQTLQNKEGLTAIDISLIQLRKSATNTKSRDMLGEFYDGNEGARFSTGLFQYYTKGQMSEKDTIQDHISTTDARGAKKSPERVIAKAQLVGLGSVLIATVTFAAAFTLPGGTNQDTGTPFDIWRYYIKAFFLADFSAFFLSFLSTMVLIYSSSEENSDRMEMHVAKSMTLFSIAAKCMVIALSYAGYLVLGPVNKMTAILINALCMFLLFFDNPNGIWRYFRRFSVRIQLLKYIPDGASGAQPKSIMSLYFCRAYLYKEFLYLFFNSYVLFSAPIVMIFILLLALL